MPSLDADVATKASFSYNTQLEAVVKKWMCEVLEEAGTLPSISLLIGPAIYLRRCVGRLSIDLYFTSL